jgi:hypothetical protein
VMSTKPRERTRPELLADLADAINELVEPRHHTEMLIKTVIESIDANGGRRRKAKRTRQRQRHTVTLPALLESLRSASVPGSSENGTGSGSFESRPAAELEALGVIRDIADSAATYATVLGVKRGSLDSTLRSLVSARHSDEQLRNLVRDANRWVKKARIATGFDAAPITLGDACPACLRRNCLTITGDLEQAVCGRCGTEWGHDTIGQLAELLRVNQTQPTAVAVRCVWPTCPHTGPHDVHQDGAGRTFRDRCAVPVVMEG